MVSAYKIPRAGGYPPLPYPPHWWWTPPTNPAPAEGANADVTNVIETLWYQYNDSQPDKELRFRDPRWIGAFKKTFGTGTTALVDFRALCYNDLGQTQAPVRPAGRYLYLSWYAKLHPAGTYDGSFVDVGFRPTSGPTVRYRITLNRNTASPDSGAGLGVDGFGAVQINWNAALQTPAWEGTTLGTEPAWLREKTRIWTGSTATGAIKWWAVHMRVPIAAGATGNTGLDLMGTFGLGFYVESKATPIVVDYRWPHDPAQPTLPSLDPEPDSSNPSQYQPCFLEVGGLSANDSAVNVGIRLPEVNIGTEDVTFVKRGTNPPQTIVVTNPQLMVGQAGVTNTFFATPINGDLGTAGTPVPAGAIKARFRLANWGSNPSPATINVGGAWRSITNATIPSNPNPIKPGGAVDNDPDPAKRWTIHNAWTPNAADEAYYSSGYNWHQCMGVDLESSDPTVTFLNSSAARNMDFTFGSRSEMPAQIGVQDLADGFAAPQRDVYIYVERINMPAQMDAEARRKYDQVQLTLDQLMSLKGEFSAQQRYVSILKGDLRHLRFIAMGNAIEWVKGNIAEQQLTMNPIAFQLLRVLGVGADSLGELVDRYTETVTNAHSNLEYDENGQPILNPAVHEIIRIILENISYRGSTPAAAHPLPPAAELEQYMPIVRYHVFHDTGRRKTLGGTTHAILEPQPSFGYYVWLDHDVQQWELRLQGADKIAEDFYVLRVPTNSSTIIKTVIHAVEEGEQIDPPERIVPFPKYDGTGPGPIDPPGCPEAIARWLDTMGPVGKAAAQLLRSVMQNSRTTR